MERNGKKQRSELELDLSELVKFHGQVVREGSRPS